MLQKQVRHSIKSYRQVLIILDSTPASLSLSSGRHPVSKKSKSLLKPKRSATNHVTASGDSAGKWLSFPTTSDHRLIIFI